MANGHRPTKVRVFNEIGLETQDLLESHGIATIEDVGPVHAVQLQELFQAKIAPLEWLLPRVQVRAISDNFIFSPVGDPLDDGVGFVVERAAYASGDFVEVACAPYYEVAKAQYALGALVVIDGIMVDEGKISSGQIAVPLDGRADISFVSQTETYS